MQRITPNFQILNTAINTPKPQVFSAPQDSGDDIGGILGSIGKIGSALKGAFGGNAVNTANTAINNSMQNISSSQIASTVLPQSMQNTQQNPVSQQAFSNVAQNVLGSPMKAQPSAIGNRIGANTMPSNQFDINNNRYIQHSPDQLQQTMEAISKVETPGAKNPYMEISKPSRSGTVSVGKYQINESNIPSWTREATGKSYTKEQFINDPQLQDKTAAFQMNKLLQQGHSPNDVASIWFTGRPLNKVSPNVKDTYGTTNADYQKKFTKYYNEDSQTVKSLQDAYTKATPNITTGVPVSPQMLQTPAMRQTLQSYTAAKTAGLTNSPYVVNIDFSQPASAKRLSVINADTGKVVFQSEVAQGSGKGFSNVPGSHTSSLGTFQTTQTYDGKNGYSLRIKGLDKGINDNAEARDIVVHGANYIGGGREGHSFGCFAVPKSVAPQLINLIKNGSIIHASDGRPIQSQMGLNDSGQIPPGFSPLPVKNSQNVPYNPAPPSPTGVLSLLQ